MIIGTNRNNLLQILFTMNGSIVPNILPKVMFTVFFGVIAVLVTERYNFLEIETSALAVFGIAIGLFLGFRNNACYDRWWEGRKRWGSLVIEVRNYARLVTLLTDKHELGVKLVKYASAHSHALRHALRGDPGAIPDRDKYLDAEDVAYVSKSPNPPDAVLILANKTLGRIRKETDLIDSISAIAVTEALNKLSIVQGSCERILTTPVPFPYTLLVHRTIWLYVIVVPFAIAAETHWFNPLIMGVIGYTFFGLDEVAYQLENPFNYSSVHSLPLEAMCRTNDISVAMALEDELIPPKLKPEGRWLK